MGNNNFADGQLSLVAALPPGIALLPEDFPERLERIKEASGLSWNSLAEKLGVDPRQVARWRKGVEPSGGAMLALMRLAMLMPGGLQMLLGEAVPAMSRDGAAARPQRAW